MLAYLTNYLINSRYLPVQPGTVLGPTSEYKRSSSIVPNRYIYIYITHYPDKGCDYGYLDNRTFIYIRPLA